MTTLQQREASSTEIVVRPVGQWASCKFNAALKRHLNLQDQTCVFFKYWGDTRHLLRAVIICSSAVHLLSASAVWHTWLSTHHSKLIHYHVQTCNQSLPLEQMSPLGQIPCCPPAIKIKLDFISKLLLIQRSLVCWWRVQSGSKFPPPPPPFFVLSLLSAQRRDRRVASF